MAVDHFAEAGKDELIAWGFDSSRSLGEFIHDLAKEGSIELREDDHISDFNGWYDLNAEPETWKLKW